MAHHPFNCDVMWCDVMLRDVMWRDVTWCDVMLRDVMWCYVMWCDVTWCDVMWCDVMWCDVMSNATSMKFACFASNIFFFHIYLMQCRTKTFCYFVVYLWSLGFVIKICAWIKCVCVRAHVCVCVCVCVRERERDRERCYIGEQVFGNSVQM
jgi:hypothetical protein